MICPLVEWEYNLDQINEFKKINIGGIDVEAYILKFEKDKYDLVITDILMPRMTGLEMILKIKKIKIR